METPSTALPQLSTYLQSTSSITAKPDSNIELAISAITHHFDSQLRKRKDSPVDDNGEMTSILRTRNCGFQGEHGAQPSPLIDNEQLSFSPRLSSHSGGTLELPTTPSRERTSRYLSEGARKEIIARIDCGEKQVALAKEFHVSRAAICNLYKKRWEVLTRGVRDPTATHPKKPHKKTSSRQVSPAASADPNCVVAALSLMANSPSQNEAYLSWPGCQAGVPQQLRHRNLLLDDAVTRPHYRDTQCGAALGSTETPKQFLVHEASAYSYPCRNLIATLRDESISTAVFQQRATRLARLLIEEVLACLPHDEEEITNTYEDLCHTIKALDAADFCAVSMEDKGMVLLRAFSDINPESPTGVVSVEKSSPAEDRVSSPHIYTRLPPINPRQFVLLLDIECATGGKACAVLHHLVHDKYIPSRNIYFVTVISAFEGLQNVFEQFPDVTLVSAQVDTVLDDHQRVRPGIGDFVQRYSHSNSMLVP